MEVKLYLVTEELRLKVRKRISVLIYNIEKCNGDPNKEKLLASVKAWELNMFTKSKSYDDYAKRFNVKQQELSQVLEKSKTLSKNVPKPVVNNVENVQTTQTLSVEMDVLKPTNDVITEVEEDWDYRQPMLCKKCNYTQYEYDFYGKFQTECLHGYDYLIE